MPREFDNMQGGHASDAIGDGGNALGIDFFQPGVSAFMPGSRDRDCVVRILPAFDINLSYNDQAYPVSFMDYRLSTGERDKETGTEAFSPWYFQCIGYPYLGNSKTGILSPKTLEQLGGAISIEDTACPIFDCQQKARNSENPQWKALTEGEDKRGADLPYKTTLVLMNALWSVAGKDWNQGIYISKHLGLAQLKTMLSWQLTINSQPLSSNPNWQKYLFGDVTHPNEGLLAKVFLSQVGSVSTYCLHFSGEQFTQKGVQQLPIGEYQLQQRHILGSSKTLKLLTYQEIVDWILQDGFLPHELVQAACGQRANVPERAPIRYDAQSTSLPPQQPANFPGAQLPVGPMSTGPDPNQKVQMKIGDQVYENSLKDTKDWIAQNPAQQVLVKPSDNTHDFMPPNQSPLFAVPQPQQQGPASGIFGALTQQFGFPGMTGQAPPQAPGMAAIPQQQQAPPQAPPQAPGGLPSPGSMGGVPALPGAPAGNMPALPGASPQGAPAHPMTTAPPQAPGFAPEAPGNMAAGPPPSQAPSLPGMAPSHFGGQPAAASPAAPTIPDPNQQDGIPGLSPANGGPPVQPAPQSQPGVPAVATASDPQPTPMGAPASGSAGPLTPEEQQELATLQARAGGQGDPLQPAEVARFAELNHRSVNG